MSSDLTTDTVHSEHPYSFLSLPCFFSLMRNYLFQFQPSSFHVVQPAFMLVMLIFHLPLALLLYLVSSKEFCARLKVVRGDQSYAMSPLATILNYVRSKTIWTPEYHQHLRLTICLL